MDRNDRAEHNAFRGGGAGVSGLELISRNKRNRLFLLYFAPRSGRLWLYIAHYTESLKLLWR